MYFYIPAEESANPNSPESEPAPDSEPNPALPPSLADVRPTGVALDVQGTILDARDRPLPGAIQALAELNKAGIPFVIVSNNSSMSSGQLAGQLRKEGFELDDGDVVTTASLTADFLVERHPGARVAFYGDRIPFDSPDLDLVAEQPDVVVLAGAGSWLDQRALDAVLRQVRAGAELIAMHRNLCWEGEDGLRLDVGALLPGLEAATRTQAYVVGKPSAAFFERALASKDIDPAGALMLGDDIDSDVLAAQRLGMVGVLVRTGKYRGEEVGHGGEVPSHVIDSIADLPNLLKGGS